MHTSLVGVLGIGVLAGAAGAQVTPIGPFIGARQEGFTVIGQWPPNGPCTFCPSIPGAFGGICTLEPPTPGNFIHVTGGWSSVCSLQPHATPRLSASTGGGGYDYRFDPGMGATKFGGYFGTNTGTPDGTAQFFDAAGAMIGTAVLTVPADCTWHWHGWEFSVPVERVRIISNRPNGDRLHMDDMEWDGGSPACYPDCDGDDALTLADFGCFQTKFALGDLYADCNGDLVLNLADFGCFQTEFALGCP